MNLDNLESRGAPSSSILLQVNGFQQIVSGAAITIAILGGMTVANSTVAQATPIGGVGCAPVPVGSQLKVTCQNTDVGGGTMDYSVLCTNLQFEYHHVERLAGRSTETMVRECGPGAHPILWGASGKTDYQQLLDRQSERERERQNSTSSTN